MMIVAPPEADDLSHNRQRWERRDAPRWFDFARFGFNPRPRAGGDRGQGCRGVSLRNDFDGLLALYYIPKRKGDTDELCRRHLKIRAAA